MLEAGIADQDDVADVLERADHASWLNPIVPAHVYYVHALSVKPQARGKRVGMRLLSSAMERSRAAG